MDQRNAEYNANAQSLMNRYTRNFNQIGPHIDPRVTAAKKKHLRDRLSTSNRLVRRMANDHQRRRERHKTFNSVQTALGFPDAAARTIVDMKHRGKMGQFKNINGSIRPGGGKKGRKKKTRRKRKTRLKRKSRKQRR